MSRDLQWNLTGWYDRKGETNLSSGLITNSFKYFGLERARSVLNRILPELAGEAWKLCRFRSGALRDSITWFVDPSGLWGAYGASVRYAAYREWGTVHNTADHFLEGALSRVKMNNMGG